MKKLLILVAVIAATVLSSCSKSNADKAFDFVQSNGDSKEIEKLLPLEIADLKLKDLFNNTGGDESKLRGVLDKMEDGDIDRFSKIVICAWYLTENGAVESEDVFWLSFVGDITILADNDKFNSKYQAMTGNAKKIYDAKRREYDNFQKASDYSDSDSSIIEEDYVYVEDVETDSLGVW